MAAERIDGPSDWDRTSLSSLPQSVGVPLLFCSEVLRTEALQAWKGTLQRGGGCTQRVHSFCSADMFPFASNKTRYDTSANVCQLLKSRFLADDHFRDLPCSVPGVLRIFIKHVQPWQRNRASFQATCSLQILFAGICRNSLRFENYFRGSLSLDYCSNLLPCGPWGHDTAAMISFDTATSD